MSRREPMEVVNIGPNHAAPVWAAYQTDWEPMDANALYDVDALPPAVSTRLIVSLDGKILSHVQRCHTGQGWVERLKTRDGGPYIEGTELARERLTGKVECFFDCAKPEEVS